MPLILNRKPGQRTHITFPCSSIATVECTGNSHFADILPQILEAVQSAEGLLIRPVGEDWPACLITQAGRVEGSSSGAFSFDAPAEVKIHRDDIRRKK